MPKLPIKYWVFVIGFILYPLVFDPFGLDFSLTAKLLYFTFLSMLVGLLFFRKSTIQFTRDQGVVFSITAGFVAVICLLNLQKSFTGFLRLACLVILPLAIVFGSIVLQSNRLGKLLKYGSYYAIILLCIGLGVQFLLNQFLGPSFERITFLGNWNLASSGLFMLLPFALIYFRKYSVVQKWVLCGVVLLGFVLLQSRAVILAVIASGFFYMLLQLGNLKKSLFIKTSLIAGVVIVLIGLIGGGIFFNVNSLNERGKLWSKSFSMVEDNMLTGVGVDRWSLELPKYGIEDLVIEANHGYLHYTRPHNDFLWIWAETGIVGLILYCLFFVYVLVRGLMLYKKTNSQRIRGRLAILLSGWLGILVISNFSFPIERVFHMSMIGLIAAAILSFDRKKTLGFNNYAVAFSVVASVFILWMGIRRMHSEHIFREGMQLKASGQYAMAYKAFEKSKNSFFTRDFASTPVEYYMAECLLNQGKFKEAKMAFLKAEKSHPSHLHILNNLGSLYAMEKDDYKALEYFKRAMDISSCNTDISFNLAATYFNLGEFELAKNALPPYRLLSNPDRKKLQAFQRKINKGLIASN